MLFELMANHLPKHTRNIVKGILKRQTTKKIVSKRECFKNKQTNKTRKNLFSLLHFFFSYILTLFVHRTSANQILNI